MCIRDSNYSTKFGTLLPLYMKKRLVGRKKSKILLLCVMASLIILKICENKKIIRFYGYEKYSGINCIFLTNNRRKMLNKHNITKQFWKICRNNMTYQYYTPKPRNNYAKKFMKKLCEKVMKSAQKWLLHLGMTITYCFSTLLAFSLNLFDIVFLLFMFFATYVTEAGMTAL